MKNKKILILLLSSDKYPSPRNEKAQKDTWIKDAIDNDIEVINFKGGAKKTWFKNQYLYLNTDDSIAGVGYKTIEAFKWVLKNRDFDILFRVNSSSYVDIDNLIKFAEDNYKENLYCGHIVPIKTLDANFVSGSGILFDKSSLSSVVSNEILWDHSLIDDVALGKLMKEIEIIPTPGKLFQLNSSPFKQIIDVSHYHYRCKIEDYGYPRFLESFVINSLYKEINKKEDQKKLWYFHYIFVLFKLININSYLFRLKRKARKARHKVGAKLKRQINY